MFTDSRPAVPSVCQCCCCLCRRPRSAPWTWTRCRWPMTTGRLSLTPRLVQETHTRTQDSVEIRCIFLVVSFYSRLSSFALYCTEWWRYLSNPLSSVHSCSSPPSRSPPHKWVLQKSTKLNSVGDLYFRYTINIHIQRKQTCLSTNSTKH